MHLNRYMPSSDKRRMTTSKRTLRAMIVLTGLVGILVLYAGGLAMTSLTLSVPESFAASNSSDTSNITSSDDGNKIDKSDEGHLRSKVEKCLDSSNDNDALEKCLSNAIDSFEFYRGQEHQ